MSQDIFKIPVEFLMGKEKLDETFKFFFEFDDGSNLTDQDVVNVIFRTILQ